MMKSKLHTKKEFVKIAKEFLEAVRGKMGAEFVDAAIEFMENQGFQIPTIINRYDDDDVRVTVYTDNLLNASGIVHVELFQAVNGVYGALYVMDDNEINDLIEEIKERTQNNKSIRGNL